MNKVLLGALVAVAVLVSGPAFAKPLETPLAAFSPMLTVADDDQIVSDHLFVAGMTINQEVAELPDTLVSKFSAAKDQDVKSASVKSASVEVGAPHMKRQV